MSNEWNIEYYKVKDLVDRHLDDADVHRIDFKRDLKTDVALEKTVLMRADGRPALLEYRYQGDLIAIIHVYFILDGNGLMSRRTECLHYIKTDESESPPIKIKDKTYGNSDVKFIIEEKKQARALILSEIKATVLVALTWANPTFTPEQVVGLGVTFSHDTKQHQDDFVEYGYPFFKSFLEAVNPADPGYEWMTTDVGGGNTLQDYMIGALTYTSESNHPEA